MRLFLLVLMFNLSLTASAQEKTLMVLGDSISAGYGIGLQQGWVHLLEERLREQGYRYHVKNASISGDTTRGARARLGKLLESLSPMSVLSNWVVMMACVDCRWKSCA